MSNNNNYPPGVSGNEPQIAGYDDADADDDSDMYCLNPTCPVEYIPIEQADYWSAAPGSFHCPQCRGAMRTRAEMVAARERGASLTAQRLDAEPSPWHLFDKIRVDYWGAPNMRERKLHLEQVRQLIADASPAPWVADFTDDDGVLRTDNGSIMRGGSTTLEYTRVAEIFAERDADVLLMQYARELLPAMLHRIEQLQSTMRWLADAEIVETFHDRDRYLRLPPNVSAERLRETVRELLQGASE